MKTLAVRVINADKTSYGGFVNATEPGAVIVAPDWDPEPTCGHGIHGWLWGIGRGGKEHAGDKIWQVVEVPDDGVDLGGKWKWKQVTVVYSGNQAECMELTMEGRQKYIQENSAASTSGSKSSASTSGSGSSASTSGARSSASTSGNYSSASTSGDSSPAVCAGINCEACAGQHSFIALGYIDNDILKYKVGFTGSEPGQLKAHTWYKLDQNNEFIEVHNE